MPLSFIDMSEDLIFGIAFSGYLGFTWDSMQNVLLTSKQLYLIGQRQIGLISCNEDDKSTDAFLTMMRTCHNVSCVNIPYMPFHLSVEVMTSIGGWYRTLHGLNLRGTTVTDEQLQILMQNHPLLLQASSLSSSDHAVDSSSSLSLRNVDPIPSINLFPQLRFLDLSKSTSEQRPFITDVALQPFRYCTGLKWLNLGMTSITNESIRFICKNMKSLENLSIPLCHGITNDCCIDLRELKLVVLDITYCKNLNRHCIPILFGDK